MRNVILSAFLFVAIAANVIALPSPAVAPTPSSAGGYLLLWNASTSDTNAADPLNYILEQCTSAGVPLSSTNVGTNLSFSATGLTPGSNYFWVVVAKDTNASLVSLYSNITNAIAPTNQVAPVAPVQKQPTVSPSIVQ